MCGEIFLDWVLSNKHTIQNDNFLKDTFEEESNGKLAKKITNVILVRQDFDILSMSDFTDSTKLIEIMLEEEINVKTYDL